MAHVGVQQYAAMLCYKLLMQVINARHAGGQLVCLHSTVIQQSEQ